jgi:23S rRNA (pseudouridine1915-N3)-methyltransferase
LKITLLWVGKTRNVHLKNLIEDYWTRLGHFCELSLREVQPVKSETAQGRLAHLEGEKLLAKVDASDYLVVLETTGRSLTTEMFASWLGKHRDQSTRNLVFLIGGHEGVSEAVRQRADFSVSLSAFTFTHEMARCVLLEQIYRAFSVIQGLPYHR